MQFFPKWEGSQNRPDMKPELNLTDTQITNKERNWEKNWETENSQARLKTKKLREIRLK